eukprot:scaffold3020_cov342-Prasinococcus_capsulatus_cf.AAC.15
MLLARGRPLPTRLGRILYGGARAGDRSPGSTRRGGSSGCRSRIVRAQLNRQTSLGSRPRPGKTGLAHAL